MAASNVIAGLDIGTRTIRVLLGEYDDKGRLVVSGWGESPAEGLRKGVVVNIEAARSAVEKAVEAAEQEAGRTITELWASLNGASVDSLNSRGVVAVTGKNREIGKDDVDRVLEAAKAVVIPMDRDILHVLPQEYIIDDQRGIRDPLDMIGVRLESEVHIVTASVSATSNLAKAVERADFKVRDMALGTLAAARSILSDDEKELGVVLIDIGAASTDYIMVRGGAPRITGSLPVGAAQATSDISIVLSASMESAEAVKIADGCCWPPLVDDDESVIIPGIGGRPPAPVPSSELCRILEPRMEELFALVRERIERVPGASGMSGGVVLTGGGALLEGAAELAGRVFGQPARIGKPLGSVDWPEACRTPEWSTAAGLVLLGDAVTRSGAGGDDMANDAGAGSPLKGFMRWLGEFF